MAQRIFLQEILYGEIRQFNAVIDIDHFLSGVFPSTFRGHLLLGLRAALLFMQIHLISNLLQHLLELT